MRGTSFSDRFREECLNVHWFASIEDAQTKIDAWRWDALIEKQLAIEDERAIFPGGARAVLLTGKAPYRALGIPMCATVAGRTRRRRC